MKTVKWWLISHVNWLASIGVNVAIVLHICLNVKMREDDENDDD